MHTACKFSEIYLRICLVFSLILENYWTDFYTVFDTQHLTIPVRFYVLIQNFFFIFFAVASISAQAKYRNLEYISQASGNFSGKTDSIILLGFECPIGHGRLAR